MILHPGILALLSGSTTILLIMLGACGLAVGILRHWDMSVSSERQLLLERRTWLVSTLLNYALGMQIVSAVLFIFTAEDIHRLFVGAMCATGALNANLVGWLVLLLKGGLFFAAAIWVIVNNLDQNTEDCPLVRPKYVAVLFLTPLVALDLYLQWLYFSGLQPEVITSCCGSLFSAQGESVASDLIGMPVEQSMMLSGIVFLIYLAILTSCFIFAHPLFRYLLFMISVVLFFVTLGAVISFISLYIYEMPTHHCPFDMLQQNYHYIGYPLYAGLFLATLYGLIPGIVQPFRKYATLDSEIRYREKSWLKKALAGLLLFAAISGGSILFSSLQLFGY